MPLESLGGGFGSVVEGGWVEDVAVDVDVEDIFFSFFFLFLKKQRIPSLTRGIEEFTQRRENGLHKVPLTDDWTLYSFQSNNF